jgi:hypothetical protein
MHLLQFLFYSILPGTFIKDIQLPVCKDCKFFIPYENKEQYTLGRCMLFGKKNIISGEITYEFADVCRISSNKCGYNGTLYKDVDASSV